jgi:hypothetical protein
MLEEVGATSNVRQPVREIRKEDKRAKRGKRPRDLFVLSIEKTGPQVAKQRKT